MDSRVVRRSGGESGRLQDSVAFPSVVGVVELWVSSVGGSLGWWSQCHCIGVTRIMLGIAMTEVAGGLFEGREVAVA